VTSESNSDSRFLELDGVSRQFDKAGAAAVDGVSLSIARGEIFALLGPSGCGKSTTLRIIAGLETPDSGAVRLGDKDITGWPPERRRMGVVFQNYALFPHLSVFENVAFGLRVRKEAKAEIERAVAEALDFVQLAGLERRSVDQLSGGQQQRVALARAIAPRPEVLLLDEPLSNLDAALREETRDTLRALLRKLDVTAVFVTHDQSEALAFADRMGLMRAGRLVESGPTDLLYHEPTTEFTASFLGGANVLPATIVDAGKSVRLTSDGATPLDVTSWTDALDHTELGARVTLVARPELVELADGPGQNTLEGRVTDRVFLGAHWRLTVELDDGRAIRALVRQVDDHETVWVRLPAESLRVVRADR
jgi:ABC-type Fe3+/spermidine/putrescine transport system ATPase subunit